MTSPTATKELIDMELTSDARTCDPQCGHCKEHREDPSYTDCVCNYRGEGVCDCLYCGTRTCEAGCDCLYCTAIQRYGSIEDAAAAAEEQMRTVGAVDPCAEIHRMNRQEKRGECRFPFCRNPAYWDQDDLDCMALCGDAHEAESAILAAAQAAATKKKPPPPALRRPFRADELVAGYGPAEWQYHLTRDESLEIIRAKAGRKSNAVLGVAMLLSMRYADYDDGTNVRPGAAKLFAAAGVKKTDAFAEYINILIDCGFLWHETAYTATTANIFRLCVPRHIVDLVKAKKTKK